MELYNGSIFIIYIGVIFNGISYMLSRRYVMAKSSKVKYVNKKGVVVNHYRINGTKEEHRSDIEKIKQEIDLRYGFNVLYKRKDNKQLEFDF